MGSRLIASAAAAICLAVAGCGSSSDATTTDEITKAEFIKSVDAVCAKGGKQSKAEFAEFLKANKIPQGKEPTSAQWAEVGTEILVPALQQQLDEIGELEVPAGDEAQISTYLDEVDEAIENLEENPAAAKSPPALLADAHRVVDGYGFKVCGGGK